MLPVSEATTRITNAVPTLPSELVSLTEAYGRFTASALHSIRELPAWHNSAMDGFALRCSDVPGPLAISGTVRAGDQPNALQPGTAVRIMTGAPIPDGADAVVIRELATDLDTRVAVPVDVKPWQNIRQQGSDVQTGQLIVERGARLGPGELGALASTGHPRVSVVCKPRVALLSTGSELVSADTEPKPGQIVNSNVFTLSAQIREAGGIPVPLEVAVDSLDNVTEGVRQGLDADVLVTIGGVSMGDYDFVRPALAESGVTLDFWKVAMKPGKPLAFGMSNLGRPVFALPGNPVSAMVVFELFVRPALLTMQRARTIHRPRVPATIEGDYKKAAGRAHYVRARARRDGADIRVTPLVSQGSGMLTSMIGVDALIEVARDTEYVPREATVSAILLRAV